MRSQRGMTLIELMTVIVLLGVLSGLSISTFKLYRASANYTVAETSMQYARRAIEAALSRTDNPPDAVALTSQTVAGAVVDADAAEYLEGFYLPPNIRVDVEYDPGCNNGGCQSDYVQIKHCEGLEFVRWIRFGDGTELMLPNLPGAGCI